MRVTVQERLQVRDHRSDQQFAVTISVGVLVAESVSRGDTAAQFIDPNTLVFSSTATNPAVPLDPAVARNANIYNVWTLDLNTGEFAWQVPLGEFPELAAKYDVPLMPFLLLDVVLNPDYNLEDGFHPNAAGHRRIAENMWPYLEPLLR